MLHTHLTTEPNKEPTTHERSNVTICVERNNIYSIKNRKKYQFYCLCKWMHTARMSIWSLWYIFSKLPFSSWRAVAISILVPIDSVRAKCNACIAPSWVAQMIKACGSPISVLMLFRTVIRPPNVLPVPVLLTTNMFGWFCSAPNNFAWIFEHFVMPKFCKFSTIFLLLEFQY